MSLKRLSDLLKARQLINRELGQKGTQYFWNKAWHSYSFSTAAFTFGENVQSEYTTVKPVDF